MTAQIRIIDYNLAQQDVVTVSASSQDSEFPASNIPKLFRSKVWRSSGNFVIDATNQNLDYKIASGGSALTIAVTPGTYTPAALATEISTQLTAAGGFDASAVVYEAGTGHWDITTTGVFLSLLGHTGVNSTTSILPILGFDTSSDQTGATTYQSGAIALHTEEWLLIDTITPQAIDSFIMIFDPMRGNPFSSSAVVTLQANATNAWTAPAISQVLTIDDDLDQAVYFWNAPQSYRFWRIKIKDPRNTNLYVELSKLILGSATQFGLLPKRGFKFSIKDQSAVSKTPYGHDFVDVYPDQKTIELDYAALSYNDAKTLEKIFKNVGMRIPITVVLDPLGSLFTAAHFAVYGKFGNDFSVQQLANSYFKDTVSWVESM